MDRKDFLKARIMEGMGKKSGTKPMSDKEKSLAALAHPKDKITHKDVLVGRGVLKKEEVELEENYRVLATKGIGAERKEDIKVGHGVDYYHPKDGSKHIGKIHSMNDKGYVVRDDKTGEKHKFQYYRRMEEEVEQMDELDAQTYFDYSKKRFGDRKNLEKGVEKKGSDVMYRDNMNRVERLYNKKVPRSRFTSAGTPQVRREEVEQVNELKKSTMASYVKKAAASYGRDKQLIGRESPDGTVKKARPEMKKAVKNRLAGINRAAERLAKEEVKQSK